jgi:hypothetical protein
MKIVRYISIAIGALLALAIVGAGIARLVIDGPIGPLAGGQLAGSERAAPADWAFSDDHSLIALEVRPEDPHSVTVVCIVSDGELYIPARGGAEKDWPQMALADARARVQIGEELYPVRLVKVEDDTERERVFEAGGKKYPQIAEQSEGQIPDGVWLFRAERRS